MLGIYLWLTVFNLIGDLQIHIADITITNYSYDMAAVSGGAEGSDKNFTGLAGVKCPACEKNGMAVWVIPGRDYPKCGYEC